jgi:hypothetical protein
LTQRPFRRVWPGGHILIQRRVTGLRSLPGGHGFKLLALPFFLIATFGVGLLGENIGLLGCALANEDPDDDDDGEDDPIACACCKVSAGICIIRTGLLSATIV